jgi:hypothetical protein
MSAYGTSTRFSSAAGNDIGSAHSDRDVFDHCQLNAFG